MLARAAQRPVIMKTTNLALALALGISTIGIAACRKSPETERKEAERAAQKADEKTREARIEAMDERNDYLAAIRREQIDYRERLHETLDDIDRDLANLKVDIGRDNVVRYDEHQKDAAKVKDLVDRRSMIRADIEALENSTEKDWDAVKARIDQHLGDRPRRGRI